MVLGSTVEEMAVLCGEGLGGWLYSSQLQWLADRANEQGTPALTVCVGVSTPDSLQRLATNNQIQCDHTYNSKDRTTEYSSPPESQTQSDHTPNSTDRITEYSSPPESQTQSDHTPNSKDRITEYSFPPESQTQMPGYMFTVMQVCKVLNHKMTMATMTVQHGRSQSCNTQGASLAVGDVISRPATLLTDVMTQFSAWWWSLLRTSSPWKPFLALLLVVLCVNAAVWWSLLRTRDGWTLATVKPLSDNPAYYGGHDKWIVADVRSGHCEQDLQAPPGWGILHVGAAAEPRETEQWFTKPTFVKDAKGETLHAWKKNVACLKAIAEGAVQILETDCSVPLTEAVHMMQAQNTNHGLMYNDTPLFNPYAHFGAWALAPRAALQTGLWNNSRLYYVRDFSKVLIQHAVSDQSTDVVVVLQTRDGHGNGVGVRFDPSSPPVYVGQRSLSPVVPGCSVYRREAFWALVDPCLSSSPHCPVLRVLLQQRLLWELDAFSSYYQISSALNVHRSRSKVTTNSSGSANLTELVMFLNSWKCPSNLSFYTCFRHLAENLGSKGFIKQTEERMMTTWITLLEVLGVEEAVRVKSIWRGVRTVSEVRVTLGSVQTRLERGGSEEKRIMSQIFLAPVLHCCKRHPSTAHTVPDISQWETPLIDDLVLIVVFNDNKFFWNALPILEAEHRPYFKHIVYCVSSIDELLREDNHGALKHVVLLEGLSDGWFLFYGCVTQVMLLKIRGVRGYVQIGDDVLLNSWKLINSSRDVFLSHELGVVRPIYKHYQPWFHWAKPRGRCNVLRTLAALEAISGLHKYQLLQQDVISNGTFLMTFTDVLQAEQRMKSYQPCTMLPHSQDWQEPSKDLAKQFLLNYYHVHKMAGKVRVKAQDFIYMPQSAAADYIPISRYFMKNRVMAELAVVNIQLGLRGPRQMKTIAGTNSPGLSRLTWQNQPETRNSCQNPAPKPGTKYRKLVPESSAKTGDRTKETRAKIQRQNREPNTGNSCQNPAV
ncbi:uncharacterized protein LOC143282563 [Babylonia areolata]|uniref:uncharacterized protein LOC143282563 n=1 Tax=Babylonia areolata TaxID=304850 RepID=UPI003FD14589